MKNRQSRVLDTLHHVQSFLDDHPDIVGSTFATSRRSLDAVEADLTSLADAQVGGTRNTRGEMNKQRARRVALRMAHMRPIAEVAKQKLRDVPEFSALDMPPANATFTQLVAHANAMDDAAAVVGRESRIVKVARHWFRRGPVQVHDRSLEVVGARAGMPAHPPR